MQHQDSTEPTGVAGTPNGTQNSVTVARNRKASAALQMRLAGATWPDICKGIGYATPRSAMVAVERALVKELHDENDKEKMRRLVGARLDRLMRSAWTKAISPDHPEHLQALAKCREVIADHRKLYGLDAPTEVVVHNPTRDELEQWVAVVMATGTPPVQEYDIFGEVTDVKDEPDALPAG